MEISKNVEVAQKSNSKRLAVVIGSAGLSSIALGIKGSFAATGSLADSINAIATTTSTESNSILTGPTGVLIGSILALIVVGIVIAAYFKFFRKG